MNRSRNSSGDMMLTFAVFAIVGTMAVAGGISLSQFNMVKSKLSKSLDKCEVAVINIIKNNLTDSAIINDPVNSQVVLDGARTACVNSAIASLGPDFSQYLIDQGNTLADMYDNPDTVIAINGQRIDVQVAVNATLTGLFPINFSTKSKPLNVLPSDLQRINNSDVMECNGGCGECGICDGATGQCIPNFRVLVTGGQTGFGPYREPRDNPEADGTYLCKDHSDTLAGQYCVANGGTIIQEAGRGGCDYGNGCKYIDNYYAWNQVGDFLTGTITLHWQGSVLSSTIPVVDNSYNHAATGNDYNRHDIAPLLHQPFGVNADSLGDPTYAVCEATGPTALTAFVTGGTYNGDFVTRANQWLGFGLIDPPPSGNPSYSMFEGIEAADAFCKREASLAGLPGEYRAILSKRTFGVSHASSWLDPNTPIQDTTGTIVYDGNGWIGRLQAPFDRDANGNQINPLWGDTVWTGSKSDGTSDYYFPLEDRGLDCAGWNSEHAMYVFNPSFTCSTPSPGLCPPGAPPYPASNSIYGNGVVFKAGANGRVASDIFSFGSWLWKPVGYGANYHSESCHQSRRLYCIERTP